MVDLWGTMPGHNPHEEGQEDLTFSYQHKVSAALGQADDLSLHLSLVSAGQTMDSSPILATANLTSDSLQALLFSAVPVGIP